MTARSGCVAAPSRVIFGSAPRARACARRWPWGRAVGPRPGRVDVRGKFGASRAIQAALRDATDRSPAALAAVLAAVINEGDPLRDLHPLFDLPDQHTTSVSGVAAFPAAVAPGAVAPSGVLVRAGRRVPVESLPLFGG
jgi:hypothetical protein